MVSVHDDRLYFDQILQLIPASHYFAENEAQGQWLVPVTQRPKSKKNKKNTSKPNKSHQERQDSLDPRKIKTIAEQLSERHEKESGKNNATLGKRRRASGLPDDTKARLRERIQDLRQKRQANEQPAKKRRRAENGHAQEVSEGGVDPVEHNLAQHLARKMGASEGQQDSMSDVEDLNYGTFDYSDGKATPAYLVKKKNQKANYSLLKRVEQEREQMEELKRTKEGQQMVREKKMEVALRRVQGEKIKDDPTRIKKTIKRRERQVEKGKEKAADRKRTEQQNQARKVKQREDNIRARAETKKANKGKRGKPRPGFEGKKKGFINK